MLPKRTWKLLITAVWVGIVGYFLYHTVEGDRGWIAQVHLQNEVAKAEDTLAKLKQERQALEHRVQLMRPESLDPDLLDEQARKELNYSKPNEIVILTPEEEKK